MPLRADVEDRHGQEPEAPLGPDFPTTATASPTTNPGPLLDLKQFAAYLGITGRHARDLIDQQRVTVVRLGRRVRVRRSEAEGLIAASTSPARRPLQVRSSAR